MYGLQLHLKTCQTPPPFYKDVHILVKDDVVMIRYDINERERGGRKRHPQAHINYNTDKPAEPHTQHTNISMQ